MKKENIRVAIMISIECILFKTI